MTIVRNNNPPKIQRIMVLGGEGQIGAPLCKFLKEKKHKVYNVDLLHGEQEDLRKMTDQVSYWISQVDFVFFLAKSIISGIKSTPINCV